MDSQPVRGLVTGSMTQAFELRADALARFEIELLTPFIGVTSAAGLILFAIHNAVPGQFAGRSFEIPLWAAILAGCGLLIAAGLKLRTPQSYEICDAGLDIILPAATYHIPFTEMTRVTSMSDRRPSFAPAKVAARLLRHVSEGWQTIPFRIKNMSGPAALPVVQVDLTTCESGGVLIECGEGRSALLSPAELSEFLRAVERGLLRQNPNVPVIREVAVRIG